jgi:hypothetical protein
MSRIAFVSVSAALLIALAAGGARAEGGAKTTGKLVVFPLEGVNVQQSVVDASTEVLASALRNQGFDIADLEDAAVEPAPAPLPPAPPPPPPPPPPDAATPIGTTAGAGQPQMLVAPPPPPPPAIAAPPIAPFAGPFALTAARKGEIARGLGCVGYVDGKLVRLGTKVRVSINKRDLDGKIVDDRQTEAKTEDDLVGVLERIAMAFAGNKSVDETLDLDNATMAETQRQANRFRLEKNFGAVIGALVGFNDSEDTAALVLFDGRFEIKDLLLGVNAGLGLSGDDSRDTNNDMDAHFLINVNVAYYLAHSNVAPYIGAGLGVFFGNRLELTDRAKREAAAHSSISSSDSPTTVGFDVYPTFGIEFLRQTSIRVHLDLRYVFDFAENAYWGHGLVALAGINF